MKTVKEYLKEYCTKVRKKETDSYIELMMDNHKCINYGGVQYYIPKSYHSNEETIIADFLIDNYSL